MKKIKITALMLTISLILTSCTKDPSEEVLDTAEEYAQALEAGDGDYILEMSSDLGDDDVAFFDEEEDADISRIKNAIADTVVCTVDEDSYTYSSGDKTCSVDLHVEICDYEEVLDGQIIFDVDGIVNAISEHDTKDFWVTLEFGKEDDRWAVTNFDDIKKDIFAFFDIEPEVLNMAEHITGVTHCNTYDSNVPVYENVDYIQVALSFDSEIPGEYYSDVYYTFEYNGEVVSEGEGHNAFIDYRSGCLSDDHPEYLAAGEYILTFYIGEGTVIYSENVIVYVNAD